MSVCVCVLYLFVELGTSFRFVSDVCELFSKLENFAFQKLCNVENSIIIFFMQNSEIDQS